MVITIMINDILMWLKQCHKLPMTGMVTIPPINMVMTGGWSKWHCFTHMKNGFPEKSSELGDPHDYHPNWIKNHF